jgi:hypothetical protein
MTDAVKAPAVATAQGLRGIDQLGGSITSENKATQPAAQATNGFYSASTIKPKRHRRTKAAVTSIRDTVKNILEQSHPQTVRQVYYAATVQGIIAKTEGEYQQTIIRLLVEARETGQIPFEWIADNTRWMRKPSSFTGVEARTGGDEAS